ncbi:MAG: glycosyltransferase [Patescibacteria group bacterium]
MKILVVSSLYEPYRRGGAEVFVDALVGALAQTHTVSILTCGEWEGARSLLPRSQTVRGVRVIRFYPLNFFSFIDINRKPFWLRVLWSCVDFFNLHALLVSWFVCIREKPDVTLVHGIKGLTLALPVLLNVMKCRWVFTPHDIQFVIPSGQLRKDEEHILSSPYVFVYRILMRRLLGSPPRVVVSSHFLADFYRSYGFFRKSDISVIPSPTPSIPVLHHHTTLSSPVTFLFCGQLTEGKGIRELLRVFESLDRSDTRISILGNGPLEGEIREYAQKNSWIQLIGYRSGEEKFRIMEKADYLIHTSVIIENSPSVIIEAFGLGVPVVSSDTGGSAELVKEGVNGFVFSAGSEKSLHDAIIRALSARDYAALSDVAKKTVSGHTQEWYIQELLR